MEEEGVLYRVEKFSVPIRRRLVCESGARRIQPVTTLSLGRRIACLIDSPDANLEIRGDVVSSGSGARDLSRPPVCEIPVVEIDIFVIETDRSLSYRDTYRACG